ncbi:alkanesulfonate monooxygenase [Sphingomonas sp. BE270]|jgi:alkanesulfonate monooxygenase|uniref:FMNH2-dependent alkanesulfonate monooxygenase n=1 Tax=unclassified Sphingomonas TaxID=196159 RepID=UPI0010F6A924|nr:MULTISPECIES: FMNH2-dependent alkanesulfonate monooxygenase [unclassified Sphingomonas]MDR7258603.1 alkanesulfonate monooxygenase [Sphingomonas sp. BE270]
MIQVVSQPRTPLDFLWFIPSGGDARYLASPIGERAPTPAYLREVAVTADRLGFYGVLMPTGAGCADAWITAASIAPFTERLKLLVALRPGLTAPAEAVRQAAALDRLSNGRALLNVVTGGSPRMLAQDGIYLDHTERYEQTAEFLDIWRKLARGDTVTQQGKYLSITGGQLNFPFVQTPHAPVWFGGSSEIAREIAAEHVDVYLAWGEPPQQLKEVIDDVRARAAKRGRTIRFGLRIHFIVRETDDAAWAAAHDLIQHVSDAQIEQFQAMLSKGSDSVGQARMQALHKGSRDNLELAPNLWAGIGLVRTGAGTALVGSPDSIAERLQEYADIGIDTVIGSGYPHIEEAYRVAELLFPKLNLPNRSVEALPPVRPLLPPIAGQSAAGRVT